MHSENITAFTSHNVSLTSLIHFITKLFQLSPKNITKIKTNKCHSKVKIAEFEIFSRIKISKLDFFIEEKCKGRDFNS